MSEVKYALLSVSDKAGLVALARALREGYLEAMNAFLDKTRKACGRLSIDYMLVRTSDPLDAVLAKFLSVRGSLPKLKG